jgi:hypothetical protein
MSDKKWMITMGFPSGKQFRTKEPMTTEQMIEQVQKESREDSKVSEMIIMLKTL